MTTTLKTMKKTLDETADTNGGKLLYSMFLLTILQTAASALLLAPVVRGGARGAAALALVLLASLAWILLHFGFTALLLRMVRGEFVTLGFVFYGLKKPRLSLPPALLLLALLSLSLFLSRKFCSFVFAAQMAELSDALRSAPPEEMLSRARLALIPAATFLLFTGLFVLIPLALVFHFRLENPEKPLLWAVRRSLGTVFTDLNYFRLPALALLASWKRLLAALALAALMAASSAAGAALVALLVNFAYILNSLTATVRIYLSAAVLYVAETDGARPGQIVEIEA